MGHWFGVRPGDLERMTFGQIVAMHDFVKKNTEG